ncbi:hypothetical protein [Pseudomonas sp. DWRC2-2]|uniref:hypothetical protein n=1 Tax=Pseudomonas sp. DWRC2-2 TaxID=2804567 RepID=UPI003CF1C1CD
MDSDIGFDISYQVKRIFVVLGSLSGIFSMLLLFSERFSILVGGGREYSFSGELALISMFASAVAFTFVYLQSGGKQALSNVGSDASSNIYVNKASRMLEEVERRNAELTDKLSLLDKKLEEAETSKGLSPEDRQRVVDGAIKASSTEAIKEVFAFETARLESQLSDNLGLDRLESVARNSVGRLTREISDLRLRSNINLIIGMSITAGGLWLLWSTVSIIDASELLKLLAAGGAESDSKFLKSLILPIIPRILLVVFVEIFAYFFLRLYRDGLSEIKYFQNELTNVESKLTAIEFAYITKDNEALKSAIEALSGTERNFVLAKGQTTVELERAKSETFISRTFVKALPRILLERKK